MKTTSLFGEKEVLGRLLRGDEQAFDQLYGYYSAAIYGNILKMVHDEEVADDILQDVFIKVWEKRSTIDPEKSFRSFLFTCSKHMVYDYIKRTKIEKQVTAYLSNKNSELYTHIEEDLQYKETDSLYQSIIAQLPPQRQKVYKMCREDGMSYEEAAQALGVSPSTIRDHLVKASKFIKEQMAMNTISIISIFLFCTKL